MNISLLVLLDQGGYFEKLEINYRFKFIFETVNKCLIKIWFIPVFEFPFLLKFSKLQCLFLSGPFRQVYRITYENSVAETAV